MNREQKPYDLRSIEPIAPALDADDVADQQDRVDRVGFAASAAAGSTPAVGVAAERMDEVPPEASEDGAAAAAGAGEATAQSR
jgi:hypothetical protein